MKYRRIIPLFAVLLVIILLEALLLARCSRDRDESADAVRMTPSPTTVAFTVPPEPTQEPVIETPVPTEIPTPPPATETAAPTASPTPSPSPSPSPTPEPTATPCYGVVMGQGSFSSDTGTAMNMNINWVAYDDGSGNAVISVTGTVSSYSLHLTTIYDGAAIDLGGYSATCNTAPIYIEENNHTVSHLFYTTLTVPLGTAGTMNVNWRYGGTYGSTALDVITAAGYVSASY